MTKEKNESNGLAYGKQNMQLDQSYQLTQVLDKLDTNKTLTHSKFNNIGL